MAAAEAFLLLALSAGLEDITASAAFLFFVWEEMVSLGGLVVSEGLLILAQGYGFDVTHGAARSRRD